MSKTLIFNAEIVDDGSSRRGYVMIDGELIAEVGEGNPAPALHAAADKEIDLVTNNC